MPLPSGVAQWWDLIVLHSGPVNPYTVAAIMDRETRGGDADELDTPGPMGTGDHAIRKGSHLAGNKRYVEVYPGGFRPADCRGWGRGLMQHDYEWDPSFCDSGDWEDPSKNIARGAEKIAHSIVRFGSDLPGTCPEPEYAAIASYNAGEGNVHHILHQLPAPIDIQVMIRALDAITTGKNYLTDVLRRRAAMMQDVTAPPNVG